MRRTITAAATAALALGLIAGPAAAKPGNGNAPGFAGPGLETTIVETAVALSGTPNTFDDNGGDFDILVAAVLATGADGILDGETDYTVFAPTDAAFVALAEALVPGTTSEADAFAVVASLGIPTVTDVLLYHVTPDWRPSPSVVNPPSITMANGDTISADRDLTIEAIGSTATIVAPDVKTADGGIHVIDAVLLPF